MGLEKALGGKNMAIITRCLKIEKEDFVLISLDTKNEKLGIMFGTIPYTEIGENGHMKRALNGLEMCLADSIERAIEMRRDDILTRDMSEEEAIAYFTKKLKRA